MTSGRLLATVTTQQIKCGDDHIGVIMKQLNQLYSVCFNNRHELVGHIFQGRYKSILIENSAAEFRVRRYIHLNPVKAGLCDLVGDWMWSSGYEGLER